MFDQTKTGALLHEDHMATISLLQEFESFVTANRKVPDLTSDDVRGRLSALVALVANEVDRHFAFEEENLFPHFGEGSGMVMLLKGEHADIRPLAQRLSAIAAKGLEQGLGDDEWKEFRNSMIELVEREIFHIQKEEMGLLAAIAMTLDAATDAALAAKFQQMAAAA